MSKVNFVPSLIDLIRRVTVAVGLYAIATPDTSAIAQSSDNACLGQLMLFGGNYCPRGYTEADGKLLSVQQYSALFSLYGTMYGGNGSTSFGIPDLRGRAPISLGQGPGLPNYPQGQLTGSPTTTLQQQNLPPSYAPVNAFSGPSQTGSPSNMLLGNAGTSLYGTGSGGFPVKMAPNMVGPLGNGLPVSTQNPIQAIRWCVALQGIYCSRP